MTGKIEPRSCAPLRERPVAAALTLALFLASALGKHGRAAPMELEAPSWDLGGYAKSLQSAFFVDDPDFVFSGDFFHARLNGRLHAGPLLTAALEARSRLFYGEQVRNPLFSAFFEGLGEDNGLVDLAFVPVREGSLLWEAQADRAWLRLRPGPFDATLGRQRINWGMALVWNPGDLFNAYNFLDFDYEERPGTDAMRVQYYFGALSFIDLAWAPGKSRKNHTAALRLLTNRWNYDFQLIGGIREGDWTAAAGTAGNLGEAALKGEMAYFHPWADTGSRAFTATASWEYFFPDGTYAALAALYTSEGSRDLEELAGTALFSGAGMAALSPKRLMPSEYTLMVQGSRNPMPLLAMSAALLYLPFLDAFILFPSLAYSLHPNWSLDLVAQSFAYLDDWDLISLGNSVFLRLRYSF